MNPYYGNAIIAIAWAILTASVFLMRYLSEQGIIPRTLTTALFAAVVGLILYYTLWTVILDTHLDFYVSYSPATRKTGAIMAGIQWQPQFRELKVVISNSADIDYQNMDLLVVPDVPVAEAGTVVAGPSVWRHDLPTVAPEVINETGRLALDWVPIATSQGYRLKSSVLPAHDKIEMVMALALPKFQTPPIIGSPDYVVRMELTDNETGTKTFVCYADKDHTNAVYDIAPAPKKLKVSGRFVGQVEKKVAQEIDLKESTITMRRTK